MSSNHVSGGGGAKHGNRYTSIPVREGTPETVELEQQDITYLQDEWDKEVQISTRGGKLQLTVSNKAGIIGLPSKRILSISPKIETNLLYLLAYTDRIDEQVITNNANAGYQVGDSLIDLLGRLFLQELRRVMRRGLAQEFHETEASQRHVRGQIQLEKQFQRQGPSPLQFECRYQELTQDIALNRVVLAAIRTLVRLLPASSLRNELIRYRELFEEWVEVPQSPLRELETVSVSHLTEHYRQLILLSKVIIQEQFLRGIDKPDHPFPSLVFDMPSVFEDAVVDAVRKNIDTTQYRVTTNDLGVLATQGDGDNESSRRLQPDFIIRRRIGEAPSTEPVVAVGDAKWKDSTTPSRNDLYQLATYQAKFGTPGLIVYPATDANIQKCYQYDDETGSDAGRGDLLVRQLSVSQLESYNAYERELETSLQPAVHQLISMTNSSS